MFKFKLIAFSLPALLIISCNKAEEVPIGDVDCNTVTFSGTIEPLFTESCLGCHGPTSVDGNLSDYDAIKVYADNGQLQNLVLTTRNMPIGKAFTSEQLGQVKCWLDDGAPDN